MNSSSHPAQTPNQSFKPFQWNVNLNYLRWEGRIADYLVDSLQIPDRIDSESQVSIARKGDVVCLVSWRKPAKEQVTAMRHQRDVCLSCGESFEFPVDAKGMCALSGKWQRVCSCAQDFSTESTVVDTCL